MLRMKYKIQLYCVLAFLATIACVLVVKELNAKEKPAPVPVTVTLTETESKIYNVESYGILPNGQDVGEKLSLLAEKVSNSGGGIIQFNKGTYVIGTKLDNQLKPVGSIRLYSNVHYRGAGLNNESNQTVLQCNSQREEFYGIFSNSDYKTENISFENLTFDLFIDSEGILKKNYSAYRAAIMCSAAKNVVIRNCRFIGNQALIETRIGNSSDYIRGTKDKGEYLNENWLIENNEFVFRIDSKLNYYDNTSVGITGRAITFRNNTFAVKNAIPDFTYYPNCCLEINGKDIWVYDNLFKEYTNAIDVCANDAYLGGRNFYIYNNQILTFRGIACWTNKGNTMNSLFIYSNTFKPVADYNEFSNESNRKKRNTGAISSVVFVSNPTATDGNYNNIEIKNNKFDYTENLKFRNSLDIARWKAVPQHRSDERIGMTFEDYYSVINLGGEWNRCDNIIIENNTFVSSVFNCIYIGGKGVAKSHHIKNNLFIDCSYNKKHHIIGLYNRCSDIDISDNTIIDNSEDGQSLKGGLFVSARPGRYTNERTVDFSNVEIQRNSFVVSHPTKKKLEYTNDISLIKNKKNSHK